VVFLADNSPATGVSWCPDCVRCGPAVKRVCAEQGASLLEVMVGERQVWRDPQHPLRCARASFPHILAYCFAATSGGG
jgi:hypothetical protein